MYCFWFENDKDWGKFEFKVTKVLKESIIGKELRFHGSFVLENKQTQYNFRSVQSVAHDVHTFEQSKIPLSPFEDKRYPTDMMHSLPYGHYKLDSD